MSHLIPPAASALAQPPIITALLAEGDNIVAVLEEYTPEQGRADWGTFASGVSDTWKRKRSPEFRALASRPFPEDGELFHD